MSRHLPSALNWSSLGRLHSIRAVRTTYLWVFIVPVAAKLLEHVSGTVVINFNGTPFAIQLSLPFSWVVFYFSALCFAFAELVYWMYCPRIVRDQSTYKEFREAGKGVEQLDNYMYQVGLNWEGLRRLLDLQDDYFSNAAEVDNPAQADGLLRKRFWATFNKGDRFRPAARTVCGLLYAGGSLLIAFVAFQNLTYVVEYLCLR